jgi:putative sterol carrier protein
MKVLALNSSPRTGGQSKTELMLNALVAGMREAGAEVTVVSLGKKTINNCAGCFSCWTKTPGTCIHKDDMTQELFPKWLESDLVVLASPLYHFTVLELGNLMWKTCIAEGITPREFGEKGVMPRPDSIFSYIELMKLGFNPGPARRLKTTIQFNFSGENLGSCILSIADDSINGRQGTFNQPDLTVKTPFEVWMDILTGKAEGQQMFLDQKYTVEGDLSLLMQMNQLFGNN